MQENIIPSKYKWQEPFYHKLINLSVPIIIQSLLMTSLNLVDTLMIGLVGETELAAVGLANNIYFLLVLMMYGVSSGGSVFIAQFWGKRDFINIHKTIAVSLMLALSAAVVFTFAILWDPRGIMNLMIKDQTVVISGGEYLKIAVWSYLPMVVSMIYSVSARAVERARIAMFISGASLFVNTILNYLLIFGKWGFPELGVEGAALATVFARIFELVIYLVWIYGDRGALAIEWQTMRDISWPYVRNFLKTTFPVILNETLWAGGMVMYSIAIARISPEAAAGYQIVLAIYRFFEVVFIGYGNACQVMVGNQIGAGKIKKALLYASRLIKISLFTYIGIGLMLFAFSGWMVNFFDLSWQTKLDTILSLKILAAYGFFKIFNLILIIGALRGGGDTFYPMMVELSSIWLIGVPLAFGGAQLGLSLPIVLALINLEEVVKAFLVGKRFKNGKWIKDVAGRLATN